MKLYTMPSLFEILAKKRLSKQLFDNKVDLTLEMPIDFHVAWVYNNIYSIPYPKTGISVIIPRQIHGIQHVTRAAINIQIFANLYRRYGDREALALNDEDIKLLQIAALFHDSAREDEDEDLWDQESGLFLYQYLTKILKINPAKAKLLAEAIANKDADTTNYYELSSDMTWIKRTFDAPKNIYQKLIHDADCLEIIRARDHFDAEYLDFYKDIAKINEEAFEIMAKLITEARSLIANQGDARLRLDNDIKIQYENQNAFRNIMNFINNHKALYPLIIALYNNKLLNGHALHQSLGLFSSMEESTYATEVTEESLTKAMYSGQLFARSMGSPAAYYNGREKEDEYSSKLEIRKMIRVKGTPTRTKKPNRLDKEGNPNRSVTMLSYGVGLYASQGFLILNPNIDQVSTASPVDFDSGRGKKSTIKIPSYSRAEKEEQLRDVHRKLKMGGTSRLYWHFHPTTHNEIIYRITKADAIYFTQDPTPYNEIMYESDKPCNPHTHYLQALFLQLEYEKATGIKLPIFEYSGVHNFIKAAPIYTEDEIVAMWVEIVSKSLKESIESKNIFCESLEDLIIKAIDGYCDKGNRLIKKQTACYLNYPLQLREKINAALEAEEKKYFLPLFKKYIKWISVENNLLELFALPLDKFNYLQRDRFLKFTEGKLIKDVYILISLLELPLEKLNALQRKMIWSAIDGKLEALVENEYVLLELFKLPSDKLNSAQRDQILTAVKYKLGTMVMKGGILNSLLALPSDKLNYSQRSMIMTAIHSHLTDPIVPFLKILNPCPDDNLQKIKFFKNSVTSFGLFPEVKITDFNDCLHKLLP